MGANMGRATKPAEVGQSSGPAGMVDLILDMYDQAQDFLPHGKSAAVLAQWQQRGYVPTDPVEALIETIHAATLATDLQVYAASPSGANAFDRLARSRRNATPEEAAAIEAARKARFGLVQLTAESGNGSWQAHDIASGKTLHVGLPDLPALQAGLVVAGRLARVGNDTVCFVGPITPLDEAALAVATGFFRPGAGLSNGQRCAEALYRHIARNGTMQIPGLNRPPDDFSDDEFPIDPEESPLDSLAFDVAELSPDAPLPANVVQAARGFATLEGVMKTLLGASISAAFTRDALAEGYRRILLVQLETVRLRETNGTGSLRLDEIAATIANGIDQGIVPPDIRTLFDDLRRRVRAAPRREGDADLEKLIQRIRALRAKTVEQGCTEQEALAAAEKVAELLDRHGLTLSELDLRRQTCEGIGVETTRRRMAPIDDCVPGIAAFFDCRVWAEKSATAPLRYIFFGLPADVEAARYLYDLVERAFAGETAAFQAGDIYRRSKDRRRATNSFQLGLARGINGKLQALRDAREATLRDGSGHDLIPIKSSIIDEELDKLGLNLRNKNVSSRKMVLPEAYEAGREAGAQFDYRPGLAAE